MVCFFIDTVQVVYITVTYCTWRTISLFCALFSFISVLCDRHLSRLPYYFGFFFAFALYYRLVLVVYALPFLLYVFQYMTEREGAFTLYLFTFYFV